jgi:regulator of protease activity HflC (stomatin/prohibitin superfamily)
MEITLQIIVKLAFIAILALILFYSLFGIITVRDFQRAIMFKHGRVKKILDPGRYFIWRFNYRITPVDVRPSIQAITGQEGLTSEGVPVKVSLVAFYYIEDPVKAIVGIPDFHNAMHVILQLAIRDILGSMQVDDVLAAKSEFGDKLTLMSKDKMSEIGITLTRADVRDIVLPADLRLIYAQIIKARKEGLASLEKARGETAALRSLANAAKFLENNPALLQLRTLQALSEMQNVTVELSYPDFSIKPGSNG